MKILIVEDEIHAREKIRSLCLKDDPSSWIEEATDGASAISVIDQKQPDLVFMDINIPGPSGVEVIQKIRHKPVVVFITAYDEYAIEAFELHAVDYILKPFTHERFYQAMEHAKAQVASGKHLDTNKYEEVLRTLTKAKKTDRITVKEKGTIFFIDKDEIQWIEASDSGTVIKSNKDIFNSKRTLSSFEQLLSGSDHLRVHRSTIVNTSFIKQMEHWRKGEYLITMKDGKHFSSSKAFRSNLERLIKAN